MCVPVYPGTDAHKALENQPAHQAQGDPRPWPQSEDKVPDPSAQFDSEAHRAFMRGLG